MSDAPWYKDAIIYELHVRSFYDSNGDGMGDFQGLTEKLDYLQDLGVSAIWLLPFYPSPWRDDGYDIADYRSVHPAYGNLRDFRRFLKEAHRRDLRLLVIPVGDAGRVVRTVPQGEAGKPPPRFLRLE